MKRGVRRGLRLALASLVAVVAAGAEACTTLIGGEDRYYESEDAAAADGDVTTPRLDATTPAQDATTQVDAAFEADAPAPLSDDAAPDAEDDTGNVVPNASFENGIVDHNCGTGWNTGQNGTITTSPIAHSGDASCLLCNPTPGLGFVARGLPDPPPGATVVSSVWLAFAPGEDAGIPVVGVTVCHDGACNPMYSPAAMPELAPDWTQLRGPQLPLGQDAGTLLVVVDVANGCVLVDDVSVFYQ